MVEIFSNGLVTYHGDSFVKVRGERTKHIPVREFELLKAKVEQIEFFKLNNSYRSSVTDFPTTFVTVTRGGQRKTVEDYAGAPKGLHDLEDLIGQVAQISNWVTLSDEAASKQWERAH